MSEIAKKEILDRVAKKAGDYEEISISCCQGTFVALQEEFNLGGGEELIKAGTFMPGIASRKETCGAVVGGLMALGLKLGKDRVHKPDTTPEEKEQTAKRKLVAVRFCEEFKKEMGSTMCGSIRPSIMGRDYDSLNPEDRAQFLADDGPHKCRVPPEIAARIAAKIILEDE